MRVLSVENIICSERLFVKNSDRLGGHKLFAVIVGNALFFDRVFHG